MTGLESTRLDELRRALREQAGLDIVTLRPASGGESGTVWWATDRAGSVTVVKVMQAAAPDVPDRLRALPTVVARLLPELIGLNDAQAGLGADPGGWPGLLLSTLTTGGDGYCVHSTLAARPDTRELLRVVRRIGDRCGSAVPVGGDFVHYDFTPANLLSDGTGITGVIDVNPPVLAGDRAFDLATLLFYCYDHDGVRERLRAWLLELASPPAARAYLAHMVLRQVDWSLRHHPGATATRRHLCLARLVIADIGD